MMTAVPSSTARLLIAGAGAVGCTLAARLAAAGLRVSLFARGATLEAIETAGLLLDDLGGRTAVRPPVSADAAALGPQDVVFLCSKAQDLPQLVAGVAASIGPQTLVVPCVNGVPFWYGHGRGGAFAGAAVEAVDPGGRSLRALPPDCVLGAIVYLTAEAVQPGHAVSRTPHRVVLGEPAGGSTPRLHALCDLLTQAGIAATPHARIRDPLWTKLIANLTSNPLSVFTGATLQQIYTEPALLAVVRPVLHEAMAVAAAEGARLETGPDDLLRLGAGMGAVRTSMLQDFDRGRPLELAAIGDAIVELGQRHRLTMPATRQLLDRARAHAAAHPPQERGAGT